MGAQAGYVGLWGTGRGKTSPGKGATFLPAHFIFSKGQQKSSLYLAWNFLDLVSSLRSKEQVRSVKISSGKYKLLNALT